jgi:hypothetical protein
MIAMPGVEDVVFVVALGTITASCRVALGRSDALRNCDRARTRLTARERGRRW